MMRSYSGITLLCVYLNLFCSYILKSVNSNSILEQLDMDSNRFILQSRYFFRNCHSEYLWRIYSWITEM